MYLDKNKKIDFDMPKTLKSVLVEMDKIYNSGDSLKFSVFLDDVESITKQCYINGSITATQLNTIFERYGLR